MYFCRREREKAAASRLAGTINSVSKIDSVSRLIIFIIVRKYKGGVSEKNYYITKDVRR